MDQRCQMEIMQVMNGNFRYPENEVDQQIEAIPPFDGASSFPNIFDLIQKAYMNTKTNNLLSNDQGASINTKSAASSLGRGANTYEDQASSPMATEDDNVLQNQTMDFNKLNKMVRS